MRLRYQQRADLEMWAAAEGRSVLGVYEDEVSDRASVDFRPALTGLIEASGSGRFSEVLAASRRRIAADHTSYLSIRSILAEKGVSLRCLGEDIDGSDAVVHDLRWELADHLGELRYGA